LCTQRIPALENSKPRFTDTRPLKEKEASYCAERTAVFTIKRLAQPDIATVVSSKMQHNNLLNVDIYNNSWLDIPNCKSPAKMTGLIFDTTRGKTF
jgi:hypothetical protein